MKISKTWIVTALVVMTFASIQTHAATEPLRGPRSQTAAEAEESRIIITRIDEINALDKASLTASEKKALRREVRQSKMRLQQVGGGVYLSAGALIIIVILLIVLL